MHAHVSIVCLCADTSILLHAQNWRGCTSKKIVDKKREIQYHGLDRVHANTNIQALRHAKTHTTHKMTHSGGFYCLSGLIWKKHFTHTLSWWVTPYSSVLPLYHLRSPPASIYIPLPPSCPPPLSCLFVVLRSHHCMNCTLPLYLSAYFLSPSLSLITFYVSTCLCLLDICSFSFVSLDFPVFWNLIFLHILSELWQKLKIGHT